METQKSALHERSWALLLERAGAGILQCRDWPVLLSAVRGGEPDQQCSRFTALHG